MLTAKSLVAEPFSVGRTFCARLPRAEVCWAFGPQTQTLNARWRFLMVSLPQVHISCYACIILYLYIIILSYELCLWFSVFRVLHHLCTTQCMYDTYMYVHILYMLYDVSLVFYRQSWRHGMATCYRSFASGSGEFGQVFRGFYKDQEVHDHVGACSTRKTWAFGQVCMQVDVHTACSVSVRLTERRCSSNYSSLWINLHIYIYVSVTVSDKFKRS